MQAIEGLSYENSENPLDVSDADTIEKRMKSMKRRIDSDADDYKLLHDYSRGVQANPYAPSAQRVEIQELRRRAVMNLMPLAISIPAQLSFAEGYRRNGEDFPEEWDVWLQSGFHSRQTNAFRAALTYGAAYVTVEQLGTGKPRLRLLSTRNTVAYYEDPVNDNHPAWGMTIRSQPVGDDPGLAVYYDDQAIIHYDMDVTGEFSNPRVYPHGLGETPMRRLTCIVDDEGTSYGVVEMLIPAQDRVNQTNFDLLSTQNFSAFKVRWATGMLGDPRQDENGEYQRDAEGNLIYDPIPIDSSTMLMTDAADAKFGTLDETPLDGFQSSLEMAVKHFAVQGQLPPHSLLGNMSNLSAETLVAAMSQTARFAHTLKTAWGQAIEDLLRLVAVDLGIDVDNIVNPKTGEVEKFYSSETRWRDMSDQTLAAQVDALGKAVQMMNVPARGVWSRFPGATTGDIETWEELDDQRQQQAYDEPESMEASVQREQAAPRPASGVPLSEPGGF